MASVELPRIGESVTEGTILRWLKNEGDTVEADEPLVEISTDKIDTELPAPVSGVLKKILVQPDETVEVGTTIAEIEDGGAGSARAGGDGERAATRAKTPGPDVQQPRGDVAAPRREKADDEGAEQPAARAGARAEPEPARPKLRAVESRDGDEGDEQRAVLSPLVRRLADQMNVDLGRVRGSGAGGRITKQDVMEAAASGGGAAARDERAQPQRRQPQPSAPRTAAPTTPGGEQVEFTRIRRSIAEHMVRSRHTAAHVTDVVEVDMTPIAALRDKAKASFEKSEGFKLTFLPFIAQAVIGAIHEYPELNAHIDPESHHATLFREVNLGIAVARDEGLIVPVVHHADSLNLVGLARAISDVANRARTKGGLKPDDVSGGTFTISNGGSYGSVIFTPIINQPQAAVLGLGAIRKVPAVVSVDGADAIAIRHRMFLCLSYDHRWIDGHKAVQFNSSVKRILEEADFAHELGLPSTGRTPPPGR